MKTILSIFLLVFLVSCAAPTVAFDNRHGLIETVQNPETLLVDVRTPEDFRNNPVPNAVNIPLAEIENNLEVFRNSKSTVVFCNSGKQAGKAMEVLKENKINNVRNGKTWKNINAILHLK